MNPYRLQLDDVRFHIRVVIGKGFDAAWVEALLASELGEQPGEQVMVAGVGELLL